MLLMLLMVRQLRVAWLAVAGRGLAERFDGLSDKQILFNRKHASCTAWAVFFGRALCLFALRHGSKDVCVVKATAGTRFGAHHVVKLQRIRCQIEPGLHARNHLQRSFLLCAVSPPGQR